MAPRRRVLGLAVMWAACLLSPLPPSPARAAPAFAWEEAYFPSFDGTVLHADILRHHRVSRHQKTPVIMSVGPYLNHAGVAGTDYDPRRSGPSPRYFDFLEQSRLLERGYTYVMVDLRGTGGSGGCTDWGGPGEQGDVKAAVEWAGSQPWSTGRVGLFGMSYDGWTGLMGIAMRSRHLAAVVAMEPVYDGYRYLYTNGVRFQRSLVTPQLFVMNDAAPGAPTDSVDYQANGLSANALCYGLNEAEFQNDEAGTSFWKDRELINKSKGARTPLFLTQGLLEQNTMPDGAFEFFNGLRGPKRAWFGQFDHVRGYERQFGEIVSGRSVFVSEVMRFFDRYVKGLPTRKAPTERDPRVAVQAIDGRYRGEQAWPPSDAVRLTTPLRAGVYPDDNRNFGNAAEQRAGDKLWSISQPLRTAVHIAGEPVLEATVIGSLPRSNLVANVYDIDPRGRALMVSRGATLVRPTGQSKLRITLYGQDWPIPAGHRIAVTLSGSNREWWMHVPTNMHVQVHEASISIPFLRYQRTKFVSGWAAQRLLEFRLGTFNVKQQTIEEAATPFKLPGPMKRPRSR